MLVTTFTVSLLMTATLAEAKEKSCGYESCPTLDPNVLNVHVVCHSHNDAGWLQTVDQTYHSAVNVIYNSTISAMLDYQERKYISAENVFFSRWWNGQTPKVQEQVRKLVRSGHLQFVGGGWTQNDEAATHYTAIIDQMTMGLRFLNDTFGECGKVRVGWQMDPFGHSRALAAIFAQMGFDGLFLGRVNKYEFERRAKLKMLQFIWKASTLLGGKANIFTNINYNVYFTPPPLCINDFGCPSKVDSDETKPSHKDLFYYLLEQSHAYSTNNIMITVGHDLAFQHGAMWFQTVEETMQGVNKLAEKQKENLRMFYSTPMCYLAALYKANRLWPVLHGDLFPYVDRPHRYWTGYFSTRPNLKYYARYANSLLQACKQVSVLSGSHDTRIQKLKEAVAILQHHDAITGTSQRHVALNYASLLSEGIASCEEVIANGILSMMYPGKQQQKEKLHFCHALNISECNTPWSGNNITVVIYNPLAHEVTHYMRLPVMGNASYEVVNHKEENVPSQVVPLDTGTGRIPERHSNATAELVFAAELPALGYTTFKVSQLSPRTERTHQSADTITPVQTDKRHYILNSFYEIDVDTKTGLVKEVAVRNMQTQLRLRQSFYAYYSSGKDAEDGMLPGAYTFNPDSDTPSDLGNNVTYKIVKGPQVQEIHQVFTGWLTQVVRLYRDKRYIEFEWIVGPIPEKPGIDVITRYETDIENGGIFYTDSNGMQSIRRSLNASDKTEPTSSSYYPVVSWIYIEDEKYDIRMTVVTDRAQGGTSITTGSLELMLHRQHIWDDDLGVAEVLHDRGADGKGIVVKGKHLLHIALASKSASTFRSAALRQVYVPVPMLSTTPLEHIERKHHSELRNPLPPEVHLLTLESVSSSQMILRLQHHFLQNPVNVSTSDLLTSFTLTQLEETLLGANQYRRDKLHLNWKKWVKHYSREQLTALVTAGMYPTANRVLITLHPGQTRTFLARTIRLGLAVNATP